MRRVLVDWLVRVHRSFSLLQETLYLTVSVLDRYLAVSVCVCGVSYLTSLLANLNSQNVTKEV